MSTVAKKSQFPKIGGPPYRPQSMTILITGTPKLVPIILAGTPPSVFGEDSRSGFCSGILEYQSGYIGLFLNRAQMTAWRAQVRAPSLSWLFSSVYQEKRFTTFRVWNKRKRGGSVSCATFSHVLRLVHRLRQKLIGRVGRA